MSDISKCLGEDCELKEECWRYLAPGGTYQSFIAPDLKGKDCTSFWPTNNEEILKE